MRYINLAVLQKGGVRVGVVQVVLRGDCNSYNTIVLRVCMYVCMYVVKVGVAG